MNNNEANTLSNPALVAAVEARKGTFSPEEIRRLSAVVAVTETRGDISGTVFGGESNDQPEAAENKPDLSPEQMTELLGAVEHRFNNHPEHYKNLKALPRLRQNVTFAEVRTCLESDSALAKKVYAMLKRDGDPDVWSRAGKSFLFFESVQNTTQASRNCVYGRAQADWLKKNRPGEQFNGSVEEQREAMGGVGVTAEEMWSELQKLGPFTNGSWEWTYSDDINDNTPAGNARDACRGGGGPDVDRRDAWVHRPIGGWRAVAKGSEV